MRARVFSANLLFENMSFGGDPSVGGWLVAVAYVLAGVYVARRRGGVGGDRRRALSVLALTLIALGLNKQLDLHESVFVAAREGVRALGWDAHKRLLQLAGVGLVLGVGIAALVVLARFARRVRPWPRSFVLAAVVFVGFVALRVAAFVGLRGLEWLEGFVLVGVELAVIALVLRGVREWTVARVSS